MKLHVARAGFFTTVQDLGRAGYRASGVSVGGALDPHAMRVANLLVGNSEASAGLELTLGSTCLQCDGDRVIAWAGGSFDVQVGGHPVAGGRPALLRKGEELIATAPPDGARAWLVFSGGIDVPVVLGSRSTDLRSNFGGFEGRALRDGDLLNLGKSSPGTGRIAARLLKSHIASWGASNEWSNTRSSHGFLRFIRGAASSQFSHAALSRESFQVTAESDRMGVRLEGAKLMRTEITDLISEAVVPGTIQVPPDGHPILLLGDCQTIGGYPKIAHVISVDLPAAAQLRPGDAVRFAEVTLEQAQQLLLARERDLQRFRIGIRLQTQ
ncbi:MAG: biotin-dependent carboxyltransferase family protein [Chthoniobacterales bacterium]|nr:biotin-dependent carboxyltransferase family protein [Chthoniobacterales bacterium]